MIITIYNNESNDSYRSKMMIRKIIIKFIIVNGDENIISTC